jgi:hypothetical protein
MSPDVGWRWHHDGYSSARLTFGPVITPVSLLPSSRFRSTQGCNRGASEKTDTFRFTKRSMISLHPARARISPKGVGISGQHGTQSAWILHFYLGITPTFLRLLACSPSTSGVNPDDDAALSSAYSSQPVRPPPRNDVLGLCK